MRGRINYERHTVRRGNIASTRLIRARARFPADSGHRERNQDNWPELVTRLNNCPASGSAFIRCHRIGRPSTLAYTRRYFETRDRDAPSPGKMFSRKGSPSSSSSSSSSSSYSRFGWNRSNETRGKNRGTWNARFTRPMETSVSRSRGNKKRETGRETRLLQRTCASKEDQWIWIWFVE